MKPLYAFARDTADALTQLRGARRLALALVLGGLAAGAFEPYRIFPLLLLSYAALVLLFDGAAKGRHRFRDAAAIAWCYGFGFFLCGLYWIGYAFLVDPTAHEWEIPFVAVLMPAGLALFFVLAGLIAMLGWRGGSQRIFLFAFAFALAEWLRGHVFTGFPWNLPAYGWGASTAILQSASVFGAYGLSLLTLLLGASLAGLAAPKTRWLPAILTLFFVALWADGEARFITAPTANVQGVRIRIVQPDTPQSEKYLAKYMLRNWRRLIDLSQSPSKLTPTHIIWPEAAAPFALRQTPEALAEIAGLTAHGSVLLTGDVRVEQQPGQPPRFYNTFDIFGANAKVLATYDKFHLVPFGEYLPLENWLRALGLTEIAADTGFSAGPGPKTLAVPGAPLVGPLICYEVIFPQAVTATPRPGWLVNVTDDSWFGPNTGPMQHLLIARVRAIEEGLPIIRAANSGISAVIDAEGRVRASLPLDTRGVIDADLPVALPPTPFARFGNEIMLMLFLFTAGAALWPLGRRLT